MLNKKNPFFFKFIFYNGGRPSQAGMPRLGPRSTLAAFVGTLCAHRPLLGSSLFPTTFNIDLFINTNCQTSLLPGPSPTPQSRHLRSPGAQLRHSIITALLGSLTPKIRWREPPGGLELSAQPKLSPRPRARRPHHFFPHFNIPPRSRHLRSPGAQIYHSIITAFRPTALVGHLGNLTPKITMGRASWRT